MVEVYGCTELGLIGTRETLVSPDWALGGSLSLTLHEDRAEVSAAHLAKPVLLDDMLAMSPDGRFRLTGRRRDIVKVGGNRVSLEGMNSLLRRIDGVADGMLFPLDEAAAGGVGRVAGVVVLRGRPLDDVRRDLRAALPAAFWPRPFRAVAEIPRGPTGKARRADLLALIGRTGPEE